MLLLVVFRSIPAALVTLLPSGLALAISTRLIGALGSGGLQISSITQVLLIVLLTLLFDTLARFLERRCAAWQPQAQRDPRRTARLQAGVVVPAE